MNTDLPHQSSPPPRPILQLLCFGVCRLSTEGNPMTQTEGCALPIQSDSEFQALLNMFRSAIQQSHHETSDSCPSDTIGRLSRWVEDLDQWYSSKGFLNFSHSIYSYDRPQRYHSEDPAPECQKFPVLTRSFATRVRISRRRGPGFRAFRSFFDMRDPQEADCGSRNRCPAKKTVRVNIFS